MGTVLSLIILSLMLFAILRYATRDDRSTTPRPYITLRPGNSADSHEWRKEPDAITPASAARYNDVFLYIGFGLLWVSPLIPPLLIIALPMLAIWYLRGFEE